MNVNSSKNKKFLITLISGLIILFLGFFISFIIVISQLIKSVNLSYDVSNSFTKHNKVYQEFFKDYDREFSEAEKQAIPEMAGHQMLNFSKSAILALKTEDNPKEYKIIINLKPYVGNEDDIKIRINHNRVSISASYKNKKENIFNSSSFYQSFTFPEKIDSSKIIKERKKDILTIIIPKVSNKDNPAEKRILPNNHNKNKYSEKRFI